jgi:anti-anti-sigma factor
MQFQNEISFETRGDVMLMDIRGDITAFSEPYLNEAYQKANDQGARKILLKIEKTAYVDSGGIAVLLQILSQTKINNQRVGITGASDHNTKIFTMLGINKFARLYPNTENALELMAENE